MLSLKKKIYQRILKFLSYRPRSQQEIKYYLQRFFNKKENRGLKEKDNLVQEIMVKLKKQDLINDQQFAEWWIEQRLTFRPKGKRALRWELGRKGIAKNIIEKTLLKIKDDKLLELAKKLIIKKLKTEKNISYQKQKQKLFSYLARRGFDFEIIKISVDEIIKK